MRNCDQAPEYVEFWNGLVWKEPWKIMKFRTHAVDILGRDFKNTAGVAQCWSHLGTRRQSRHIYCVRIELKSGKSSCLLFLVLPISAPTSRQSRLPQPPGNNEQQKDPKSRRDNAAPMLMHMESCARSWPFSSQTDFVRRQRVHLRTNDWRLQGLISKGRRKRAESGQPGSRRDVTAPEESEGRNRRGNNGCVGNVWVEMSQMLATY